MENTILEIFKIQNKIVTERNGVEIHQREIPVKKSQGLVYGNINKTQEATLKILIDLEKRLSKADIMYKFKIIDSNRFIVDNLNCRINGQDELIVKYIHDFIASYAVYLKTILKIDETIDKDINSYLDKIITSSLENNFLDMRLAAQEISKKIIANRR